MINYTSSIEDCLTSGEYDQGDKCLVDYDELYDLVNQGKGLKDKLTSVYALHRNGGGEIFDIRDIEKKTNRPLHPCLGGKSPYNEFGL